MTNQSPSENHSNQSSDREPTLPHYPFLIDMQLPKMLNSWIPQKGHEARHVQDLRN